MLEFGFSLDVLTQHIYELFGLLFFLLSNHNIFRIGPNGIAKNLTLRSAGSKLTFDELRIFAIWIAGFGVAFVTFTSVRD